MRKKIEKITYFFVDESGDPTFYDRNGTLIVGNEGTSKILILGFIKTEDPKAIRQVLTSLRDQLAKDAYLQGIPSLEKSLVSFHAKDDCAEVRQAVYRGSRLRQKPLEEAIEKAVKSFEEKWKVKIDSKINIYPQSPSGEPCLQLIDYVNWAIQRAYIKGDMRFYKFIEDKVSYLVDIYDTDKYPKNFYNRKNKFDVNKISPL